MRKNTKTNTIGFTLIELMIVVAIIGILAAIAVPKFSELMWKSENTSRARRGLPPLPAPSIVQNANPNNGCYGDVVSAFQRVDGGITKVYRSGCVER